VIPNLFVAVSAFLPHPGELSHMSALLSFDIVIIQLETYHSEYSLFYRALLQKRPIIALLSFDIVIIQLFDIG